MTEDTSEDRERYVKTTLRELLVYIVFLVDICLRKYVHVEQFFRGEVSGIIGEG